MRNYEKIVSLYKAYQKTANILKSGAMVNEFKEFNELLDFLKNMSINSSFDIITFNMFKSVDENNIFLVMTTTLEEKQITLEARLSPSWNGLSIKINFKGLNQKIKLKIKGQLINMVEALLNGECSE